MVTMVKFFYYGNTVVSSLLDMGVLQKLKELPFIRYGKHKEEPNFP